MASSNETSENDKVMKKALFSDVMAGDWKEVVEMYKIYPEAHTAKITRSGYTALHLAVSNGQESIVEELVQVIKSSEHGDQLQQGALKVQNERGYTALHFAAAMGNEKMCKCIANVDPTLVGVRNNEGETPLFSAVLYGQQEAFLCLHGIIANTRTPGYSGYKIPEEEAYSYCRRKDQGETILHCAIYGEDFDLAFHIINEYEGLLRYVDEEGFSPLDTLATKPSCFESGSNLRGCDKIIYKCVHVNELKPLSQGSTEVHHRRHPENYRMFVHCIGNFVCFFGRLLKNAFRIGPERNVGDAENQNREQTRSGPERNEGDAENQNKEQTRPGKPSKSSTTQRRRWFPDNYNTCYEFFKLLFKAVFFIFGFGHSKINLIRQEKEKHVWAVQILSKLLDNLPMYESLDLQSGVNPGEETGKIDRDIEFLTAIFGKGGAYREEDTIEKKKEHKETAIPLPGKEHKGTAILLAAKHGITEIVDEILKRYPVAIHDADKNMKNILLLAAKHRQLEVYKLLLRHTKIPRDIVFRKVDKKRNSALHFAARYCKKYHKPWPIPGSALQMQWEIKWYKFVEESMPPHFFLRANKKGKTPKEIFTKTHKGLVKDGGRWLTETSTSCSVVACLIATVAFASSTTFPGGTDSQSGKPTLEDRKSFQLFAVSSLVALCSSVTSLIMFLAILTSRHQEKAFGTDLPRKLLLGLSSLFVSIAAMITSFCAGHFFALEDKLKYLAFPVYAVTFLPVCLFAVAQFPLYLDLFLATFRSPF